MTTALSATELPELTAEEYGLFRDLVHRQCGINLGDQKTQLVRGRLGKILRDGNYASFHDYYRKVEADTSGRELGRLLDAISTNTTHLFREMRHFKVLANLIRGWVADAAWRSAERSLRIWSSACSSGEEPHSIAMTALHVLNQHPEIELKLLATDISTKVLARASIGMYSQHRVGTVPADLRKKYLIPGEAESGPCYSVAPEVTRSITFARFNLMRQTYPFRQGFHVIFCRNVMIYFDRPTTESVVQKLAAHLVPGGVLMIGHSESLTGVSHPLEYLEPTVYRKPLRTS